MTTAKPKPDDKAQSKRFIDTARKVGANRESSGAADMLMGRLVKQAPAPIKPTRKGGARFSAPVKKYPS